LAKLDKLAKLVAVFDEFHQSISILQDERALQLCTNWNDSRQKFANPSGEYSRSALAQGMEQGLRETPMLMKSLPPKSRLIAAKALSVSLRSHFPDFLVKEAERLNKVRTRGSIKNDSEYYLVRYQVDVLEGSIGSEGEVNILQKLIGCYEGKRH
jgi:hypothetical protein